MNKLISRVFAVTIAALASASALHAEAPATKGGAVSVSEAVKPEAKGMRSSFNAWLKDLRRRVARTRAHQNQLVAVAAVRGNETPDAPPLYWKGKRNKGPVDAAELDQFEKAVDAAIEGKPEAREMLEKFVADHPKSTMVADAKAAIERMESASTEP